MSVSTEVKRTLVKSPPELWSELSDAESLAQHLGGMDGVRITRAEPESTVEWEAAGASGSVLLSPSGFGTKVVLSLTRELPTREPVVAEPVVEAEEPQAVEPAIAGPSIDVTESAAEVEPNLDPNPEPVAESDPAPESEPIVGPNTKSGFFTRLFRRRGRLSSPAVAEPIQQEPLAAEPAQEPTLGSASAAESLGEPESMGKSEEVAEPEPTEEPVAEVAIDLAALEAQMASEDEVMLAAMLDRLGAAHHRPFSRS